MSLINKMLQDLDARGTPGADAFSTSVKPVAPVPRGPSRRAIVLAAGAVVAVVALAGAGMVRWSAAHLAPQPHLARTSTAHAVPVTPVGVSPAAPSSKLDGVAAERALSSMRTADAKTATRAATKSVVPAAPDAPALAGAAPDAATAMRSAASETLAKAPGASRRPAAVRAVNAVRAPVGQPSGAASDMVAAADLPVAEGRQPTSGSGAEGDYRRALLDLQDGRVIGAIAALQHALRVDPTHGPARQTLIGLLVEANRPDDAIRELQLGLAQDPRQPAMAMLLARLQIERGGTGLDTLTRTLPYAGNDPGYRAFLAGALQRQGRQREAAEQYRIAVGGAPDNGVWWMGLGIALQADRRNAEALDAFRKARAAAGLNEDLRAFVERQVALLGR